MPRISSPGNPDCFVDCPGSGYAYYPSPFGPCKTGCDDTEAGDALAEQLRDLPTGRFSGRIVGLRLSTLVTFADNVMPHFPEAIGTLLSIQQIVIVEDRRINADWSDADAIEVIETLARAASGRATRAAAA